MDYFILFIALPVVVFVVYTKLRKHLKQLEDELSSQRSNYEILRTSTRELQLELKRLEHRIDMPDSEVSPNTDVEVKDLAETQSETASPEPPVEAGPEAIAHSKNTPLVPKTSPPPLPPSFAASAPKPQTPSPLVAEIPVHTEPAIEVPTPAPSPSSTEPSFFERIPWRSLLERFHLWPPDKTESGESAETQLAAWWAIRIGLILVIIAAVFFGVYVSQHTPAWLRVLALSLISLGTIALGTRMKDNLEGFGRAITGGGFALLYFTAFAAFALPATKIIDSPTIGILSQLSALLASITWSLWKKDQTIATLTLLLGFISCTFSHTHDLDRFTFIGLMLLAATGSFLFAQRGWLTTFITSLAGSWTAYTFFVLLDWHHGNAASFVYITATLVTLSILFEAGNLLSIARQVHPLSDRWRRWLILSNTSAAAVIGYSVTRLVYPDQLSSFYFIFALLYFAFTLIHYFRSTDEALTETLFLKSSALLCLGFASAFDGPVRWLAIAFQSFALLWTARRSGSRWIALGFALVFAASIAWFWRDLTLAPPEKWLWFETFRLAGSFYLIFLTVQLTLHSKWFPSGIGGSSTDHHQQAHWARLAGAVVIGISTIIFALSPSTPSSSEPLWFLLILSAAIGLVCPVIRRATPCLAAALPLLATYLGYVFLSHRTSQTHAALLLGITLIALAFGLAEIIRRFWPAQIKGAAVSRSFTLLTGLVTLLPFTHALSQLLSISNNSTMGVFALFPIVATAAILIRQQNTADGLKTPPSITFSILTGLIVFTGGLIICSRADFFPSALTLASLPLLATLFRIHNSKLVFAGAIPLSGAFLFLWRGLLNTRPGHLTNDSINLVVALVAVVVIATLVWKKVTSPALQKLALYSDTLLHGLAILSLHLFFQKHLGEGPDFFASSLLGITLLLISRRFPFRVLAALSWLPVTLAIFSGLLNENWQGVANGQIWFWLTGLATLLHLLLTSHWTQKGEQADSALLTDTLWISFPPLASFIALGTWTLVVLAATADPWQAAALSGIALLYSALWRWGEIKTLGPLALFPLALASLLAYNIMFFGSAPDSPIHDLLSVLLTASAFVINGILLAGAQRHLLKQKITSYSVLPWLHAGAALFITFTAFAMDHLVSENLTAVFWGIAAITLFVSGLFAGLRAYRLTGLLGLLFCIFHIFIWDIQDNFYRIIAFFAVGLVLLAIGFLYLKFRDRIAALDS